MANLNWFAIFFVEYSHLKSCFQVPQLSSVIKISQLILTSIPKLSIILKDEEIPVFYGFGRFYSVYKNNFR